MVIETFDKTLLVNINDQLFGLEVVEQREVLSKTFDEVVEVKPKKQNIQRMNHPWKQASFNVY